MPWCHGYGKCVNISFATHYYIVAHHGVVLEGELAEGGCTGLTLKGLLDYLRLHPKVRVLILENVRGILEEVDGKSVFDFVKSQLEKLGFTVIMQSLIVNFHYKAYIYIYKILYIYVHYDGSISLCI
jgi:hypothetical protein